MSMPTEQEGKHEPEMLKRQQVGPRSRHFKWLPPSELGMDELSHSRLPRRAEMVAPNVSIYNAPTAQDKGAMILGFPVLPSRSQAPNETYGSFGLSSSERSIIGRQRGLFDQHCLRLSEAGRPPTSSLIREPRTARGRGYPVQRPPNLHCYYYEVGFLSH
jgi:hypothetical protein